MKFSTKLFLAVFLISMMIIPALGVSVFYLTRGVLQEELIADQLQIAMQQMNAIDQALYRARREIQIIASDGLLEQEVLFFQSIALNGGSAENTPAKNSFTDTNEVSTKQFKYLTSLTGPWDAVYLVDRDGVIRRSTVPGKVGGSVLQERHDRHAYEAALRGEVYDSDLVISAHSGRPTVVFSVPIHDWGQVDRPIVGLAIAYFAWPVVLQILDENTPDINAHLFNRDGVIIADRSENSRSVLETSLMDVELVRQMLQGERVWGSAVGQGAHGFIGPALSICVMQQGFLTYKGKRWGLLLELPTERVFKPIYRITGYIALVSAVSLGVLAITLFWIFGKIANPIRSLTNTVQLIAGGNLTARAPVTTQDEIGVLAIAFNKMSTSLQKSFEKEKQNTLTQRQMAEVERQRVVQLKAAYDQITQKTEELGRTNEELRTIHEETQQKSEELESMNEELRSTNEEIESANRALQEKSQTLERFQKITVGRELEMTKLKKEINSLLETLGRPKRYEEHNGTGT
jgi:HAMP domain-containing protein